MHNKNISSFFFSGVHTEQQSCFFLLLSPTVNQLCINPALHLGTTQSPVISTRRIHSFIINIVVLLQRPLIVVREKEKNTCIEPYTKLFCDCITCSVIFELLLLECCCIRCGPSEVNSPVSSGKALQVWWRSQQIWDSSQLITWMMQRLIQSANLTWFNMKLIADWLVTIL